MFQILVLFSRFIFIACGILFLWNTVKCLFGRDKETESDRFILIQRIIICVIDILGFVILQIGGYSSEIGAVAVGFAMLVYIFSFSVITDRMYKYRVRLISNCTLFLMTTGLIMLQRLDTSLAIKQLVWFCAGLVVVAVMPVAIRALPKLYKFKYLYIILALGLTAATFMLGEETYGSKNWISLGPIGFQPSEVSKLLLIMYLASVFKNNGSIKNIFVGGIPAAAIVILLVLEKDLGGALIFFMTYMIMMYVASGSELFFIGGMGAASVAAFGAYKMFSHVRVRVAAWIDPWKDIDTGGY